MVLLGFADFAQPDPTFRERAFVGEAEHVVWSVPPPAAAGLIDRADEWRDLSDTPRDE